MTTKPIRIILVDDHSLVRESWEMLLKRNPRFEVVASCDNGHTGIREAEQYSPDILLVDINMHPLTGFDVTEKLMRIKPSIKIIGVSVHNDPRYANRIMELGAKGYITKSSPLEEIHHAITEVSNGKKYICEEVRRKTLSEGRK